jgi:PAS domain S-box-containing protein
MVLNYFWRRSLKARVTFFTLGIFVISIWSLAFYASRMLRVDMQRLLGEQQYSAVSLIAADINDELAMRLKALEDYTNQRMTPAILGDSAAMQARLAGSPIIQGLFNGGVIAIGADGNSIAAFPHTTGVAGVNFMDTDHVAGALKGGKATIGRPVMGKPIVGMTMPIRDPHGNVIGALSGLTDLGRSNFLAKITDGRYGKTGGYLLVSRKYRQVVTASDKSRILESYPASGTTPLIERRLQGRDGTEVFVGPDGEEVLSSAKGIPIADWYVSVELSAEEAFAPIRAMQERMLLATIALTLLAGGLTWWILRRQLAPMLATVKTLATLSHSPNPNESLPVTSQDEIGELIGGFNRLLESLAKRGMELRESEQHFRTIANSGSILIWTSARDKLCDYFNEPWMRFTGRTLDQELGNGWTDGVHPDDLELCLKTYVAAFDRREPFSMEYRLRHADGSYRWLRDDGSPRYDSKGDFLGYIGFCMDISERKRHEQLINENTSLLEHQKAELEATLGRITRLEGMLSICMQCKKIRTENNDWHQLEKYIGEHSDASFSHGICPECLEKEMKKLD